MGPNTNARCRAQFSWFPSLSFSPMRLQSPTPSSLRTRTSPWTPTSPRPRATIDDMIADGASDADCRKLTGDTINDIKSSVEILQKEIDAVTSGVECNSEGQTQVKITAEAETKAHTTLTTAKKELTKCTEAKVDFGSRVYSTLTVGKCDTFFSHGAYVTAKASFQTATT